MTVSPSQDPAKPYFRLPGFYFAKSTGSNRLTVVIKQALSGGEAIADAVRVVCGNSQNECTLNTHNCHKNATCADTASSFTCACKTGFTGSGTACADANECTVPSHNCHANTTCSNTVGSFTCACTAGFFGDGVSTCVHIDAGVNNGCQADSTCVDLPVPAGNNAAGRTCTYNTGYFLNGAACTVCTTCGANAQQTTP